MSAVNVSARWLRSLTGVVCLTLAVALGGQAPTAPAALTRSESVVLASSTATSVTVRIPGTEYVGIYTGIRIRANRQIARWRIEFSREVHRPSGANVTVIRGTGKPPYEVLVRWRSTAKVRVHTRVVLGNGAVYNIWKSVNPVSSVTTTSSGSQWSSTVYPKDTFKAFTWVDPATHSQPSVTFTVNLESPYWRSGEDGILRTSGQYKTVTYHGIAYMSSTMADSDLVTVYGQGTYTLMPADLPNSTERMTICNDLIFEVTAGTIRAMQSP